MSAGQRRSTSNILSAIRRDTVQETELGTGKFVPTRIN